MTRLVVTGSRDSLVGIEAFAAELKMAAGTLKRWIHEGMPVLRSGRRVAIDRAKALEWIQEHHATSCSFERRTVVYACRGLNTGRIKVGYSHDAKQRARELKKTMGEPVELLVAFPGTKKTENVLHALLKPWCVGPEVYAPVPALLEFIERVKGAA